MAERGREPALISFLFAEGSLSGSGGTRSLLVLDLELATQVTPEPGT